MIVPVEDLERLCKAAFIENWGSLDPHAFYEELEPELGDGKACDWTMDWTGWDLTDVVAWVAQLRLQLRHVSETLEGR